MPTYEYQCSDCGHQFEEFQSITASPLRKCPECGKLRLKRLIGIGAGVIFKGSGFYETDYRSDSYKKAAEAESKSSSDGDGKKSDSKTSDKAGKSTEKKTASAKSSDSGKSTSTKKADK
jgi:putative FmdB family regulatory protein